MIPKTTLVVITRNGKWYRMGDISICAVTDEEYSRLTNNENPLDISPTLELTIKNITHRQVGSML